MCRTDRLMMAGINVESGRNARVDVRSTNGIKTGSRYSLKMASLRLIPKAIDIAGNDSSVMPVGSRSCGLYTDTHTPLHKASFWYHEHKDDPGATPKPYIAPRYQISASEAA